MEHVSLYFHVDVVHPGVSFVEHVSITTSIRFTPGASLKIRFPHGASFVCGAWPFSRKYSKYSLSGNKMVRHRSNPSDSHSRSLFCGARLFRINDDVVTWIEGHDTGVALLESNQLGRTCFNLGGSWTLLLWYR